MLSRQKGPIAQEIPINFANKGKTPMQVKMVDRKNWLLEPLGKFLMLFGQKLTFH